MPCPSCRGSRMAASTGIPTATAGCCCWSWGQRAARSPPALRAIAGALGQLAGLCWGWRIPVWRRKEPRRPPVCERTASHAAKPLKNGSRWGWQEEDSCDERPMGTPGATAHTGGDREGQGTTLLPSGDVSRPRSSTQWINQRYQHGGLRVSGGVSN